MKLYVVAGKAKSGKDETANIIKKIYKNKKVLKYSSTKYLKDYVKMIKGEYEEKPRDFLQELGFEIKEKYPNFFIDRIKEDIDFLSDFYDIIIVTGVRLTKELDFFKNNYNATLIKIERNIDNGLTEKQKNDITELDVDNYLNYDFIIRNSGSLEELEKNVIKIVRR